MEPTDAQKRVVREWQATFSKRSIKPHAPHPTTGIMRVEAVCMAGVWQWFVDRDGVVVEYWLKQAMFEIDPVVQKPRNALDN